MSRARRAIFISLLIVASTQGARIFRNPEPHLPAENVPVEKRDYLELPRPEEDSFFGPDAWRPVRDPEFSGRYAGHNTEGSPSRNPLFHGIAKLFSRSPPSPPVASSLRNSFQGYPPVPTSRKISESKGLQKSLYRIIYKDTNKTSKGFAFWYERKPIPKSNKVTPNENAGEMRERRREFSKRSAKGNHSNRFKPIASGNVKVKNPSIDASVGDIITGFVESSLDDLYVHSSLRRVPVSYIDPQTRNTTAQPDHKDVAHIPEAERWSDDFLTLHGYHEKPVVDFHVIYHSDDQGGDDHGQYKPPTHHPTYGHVPSHHIVYHADHKPSAKPQKPLVETGGYTESLDALLLQHLHGGWPKPVQNLSSSPPHYWIEDVYPWPEAPDPWPEPPDPWLQDPRPSKPVESSQNPQPAYITVKPTVGTPEAPHPPTEISSAVVTVLDPVLTDVHPNSSEDHSTTDSSTLDGILDGTTEILDEEYSEIPLYEEGEIHPPLVTQNDLPQIASPVSAVSSSGGLFSSLIFLLNPFNRPFWLLFVAPLVAAMTGGFGLFALLFPIIFRGYIWRRRGFLSIFATKSSFSHEDIFDAVMNALQSPSRRVSHQN